VIFIAKNPYDIQENDEAVLSINELQIEGTLEEYT
jgi:hypothetical protein